MCHVSDMCPSLNRSWSAVGPGLSSLFTRTAWQNDLLSTKSLRHCHWSSWQAAEKSLHTCNKNPSSSGRRLCKLHVGKKGYRSRRVVYYKCRNLKSDPDPLIPDSIFCWFSDVYWIGMKKPTKLCNVWNFLKEYPLYLATFFEHPVRGLSDRE